eukprot:TRINITY_DN2828_c0_g1_i1.p1 TRINITY_DN2828_c0_g1~~TRINITY_DN2828_c0_g1_i1.p1  ORF type:complete len:366 (+),score=30.39 TRINITY_DN2828_c0_g1_i1:93-1190(+)
MSIRSSSSLFFTFLLFLVAASVAVNVAARPVNPQHGHHAKLRVHTEVSGRLSDESFELVNVLEFQEPGSNELPEFQIAVKVNGKLQYLYSEGTKVLSTPNPDSVGTPRTFWKVVDAPSDRSALSRLSFAVDNKDTGARLYYDYDTKSFQGGWVESGQISPFTNFRLWRSEEDSSRYRLQNIQGSGRGEFAEWPASDEPHIFHIKSGTNHPVREEGLEVVPVPVGTKFQLTERDEDGRELYLYSEGEKVLRTPNPDSVGTLRTIWQSVEGISPRSAEYADAFAIRNTDTEYHLLFDGELYGKYYEGAGIAGWKLYFQIFAPLIYPPPPPVYKLAFLPYSNGFIPGTFNYLPREGNSERVISLKVVK